MGVNVRGIINCTRAVLPQMQERRSGSIVNVSSIAGYGNISPLRTFYSATKAAVMNMTKRFALELGPDNINVNSVAPGLIRTDLLVQLNPPRSWSGSFKSSLVAASGTDRRTRRHRRRRGLPRLLRSPLRDRAGSDRRRGTGWTT